MKNPLFFQESHVHDSIALKICNEIFSDPEDVEVVKIYLKTLTQLTICPNNVTVVQDLKELTTRILDVSFLREGNT